MRICDSCFIKKAFPKNIYKFSGVCMSIKFMFIFDMYFLMAFCFQPRDCICALVTNKVVSNAPSCSGCTVDALPMHSDDEQEEEAAVWRQMSEKVRQLSE